VVNRLQLPLIQLPNHPRHQVVNLPLSRLVNPPVSRLVNSALLFFFFSLFIHVLGQPTSRPSTSNPTAIPSSRPTRATPCMIIRSASFIYY
jgi:hypothetical protein